MAALAEAPAESIISVSGGAAVGLGKALTATNALPVSSRPSRLSDWRLTTSKSPSPMPTAARLAARQGFDFSATGILRQRFSRRTIFWRSALMKRLPRPV